MSDRLISRHFTPPKFAGLCVAVLLLTASAGYLYLLKQPITDYRRLSAKLEQLGRDTAAPVSLSGKIATHRQAINALQQQLHGDGPRLPPNQLIAHVIGQLDVIAADNQVQLISVQPEPGTEVMMFEETPFQVVVTGGYFSLFHWLQAVEQALGPMVVKEFVIDPLAEADIRRMQLTLVSYRLRTDAL